MKCRFWIQSVIPADLQTSQMQRISFIRPSGLRKMKNISFSHYVYLSNRKWMNHIESVKPLMQYSMRLLSLFQPKILQIQFWLKNLQISRYQVSLIHLLPLTGLFVFHNPEAFNFIIQSRNCAILNNIGHFMFHFLLVHCVQYALLHNSFLTKNFLIFEPKNETL